MGSKQRPLERFLKKNLQIQNKAVYLEKLYYKV